MTEDLLNEGIVREFISKVQNLRKSKDFEITDRIHIYYKEQAEFEKAIKDFIELIKEETLALSIEKKENDGEVYNLNGLEVQFDVEQVK